MRYAMPVALTLLSFILFAGCSPDRQQVVQPEFSWEFRHVDSVRWLPATVPGCTHLDLLNNGMIPDPFFGDNEQKLQWIRRLGEGEFLVSGHTELAALEEKLALGLPDGAYETLGGFLLELFGEIPAAGRSVQYRHMTFTVEKASPVAILEVRVTL